MSSSLLIYTPTSRVVFDVILLYLFYCMHICKLFMTHAHYDEFNSGARSVIQMMSTRILAPCRCGIHTSAGFYSDPGYAHLGRKCIHVRLPPCLLRYISIYHCTRRSYYEQMLDILTLGNRVLVA